MDPLKVDDLSKKIATGTKKKLRKLVKSPEYVLFQEVTNQNSGLEDMLVMICGWLKYQKSNEVADEISEKQIDYWTEKALQSLEWTQDLVIRHCYSLYYETFFMMPKNLRQA